ncbi:hypothetical protein [Hymenobacter sp. DG25A]|uniref:hypothetical protein n=1 Tax=Hymenobacter sp. DG25A TaxID=1385663 RepID=UPI0006BDF7E8|nr:hypothetical protein [Hymenobacter sp. DG25A]ALD21943.1 hypothetical protein AM218_12915 [Hymenobacter sp. DG25A]
MRSTRSRLAFWLLLCFLRVLLPDSWILALHTHQHTHKEVSFAPHQQGARPKAVLTTKHQHCPIDQFYSAAFQPALPLELPPPAVAYGTSQRAIWVLQRPVSRIISIQLRGPPPTAPRLIS